jgi:hypothetical protein
MAGIPNDPYAGGRGSLEDLLRDQDMSTGPDPQAFIGNLMALERMRQGITNEVDMGPDPYEGNPNREPFPEELDPYQVAGDVVKGPFDANLMRAREQIIKSHPSLIQRGLIWNPETQNYDDLAAQIIPLIRPRK